MNDAYTTPDLDKIDYNPHRNKSFDQNCDQDEKYIRS